MGYESIVGEFQKGSDWADRRRANKQLEKARELGLEGGEYDMQARRAYRKLRDPASSEVLGELDPSTVQDYQGLEDPFAVRLFDWFKSRRGKGAKKRQAIDMGEDSSFGASNPSGPGEEILPMDEGGAGNPEEAGDYEAETYALPDQEVPEFADGGAVTEEDLIRERAARNRAAKPATVSSSTETVQGANRAPAAKAPAGPSRLDSVRKAINFETPEGSGRVKSAVRAGARGAARLGAAAALVAPIAGQTDDNADEKYAERFGWGGPGEGEGDESFGGFMKYFGMRGLGYASDVADFATGGLASGLYRDSGSGAPDGAGGAAPVQAPPQAQEQPQMAIDISGSSRSSAPRRSAIPQQQEQDSGTVDFSKLDIDPKEVPDMKTDDWVQYRARMIDAARQTGDPSKVKAAGDLVTEMQQKGFINYGQQGLMMQQAGNTRGAMAAYRAAFQYFPNGNDVEFGTMPGKNGRQQIVGVGLDEKTRKVVPGSEMIMDPERVSVLLENFSNPASFRAWTKDWRAEQFKERQYQEVTKPLAQGTLDYQANNSEANMLRAENSALRGGGGAGGGAANMRNAERVFRTRVQGLGVEDEAQADFLASIMSQVKAKNPQTPDNTIVQGIMSAHKDGTLAQRLQRMGIQTPSAGGGGAAPQTAIPVDEGDASDPEMSGLSPEEIEWANRPAE